MKKLSAIIDRLEEKKAVLKFSDGQSLTMDISYLPDGAGEGEALDVSFGQNLPETSKRLDEAKALLNEILKKHE